MTRMIEESINKRHHNHHLFRGYTRGWHEEKKVKTRSYEYVYSAENELLRFSFHMAALAPEDSSQFNYPFLPKEKGFCCIYSVQFASWKSRHKKEVLTG